MKHLRDALQSIDLDAINAAPYPKWAFVDALAESIAAHATIAEAEALVAALPLIPGDLTDAEQRVRWGVVKALKTLYLTAWANLPIADLAAKLDATTGEDGTFLDLVSQVRSDAVHALLEDHLDPDQWAITTFDKNEGITYGAHVARHHTRLANA